MQWPRQQQQKDYGIHTARVINSCSTVAYLPRAELWRYQGNPLLGNGPAKKAAARQWLSSDHVAIQKYERNNGVGVGSGSFHADHARCYKQHELLVAVTLCVEAGSNTSIIDSPASCRRRWKVTPRQIGRLTVGRNITLTLIVVSENWRSSVAVRCSF
jgi:hypothetical protein